MGIVGRFDHLILVKQAREGRRISNRDIARHFDVNEATVWRWRRGEGFAGMPLSRALDIANWLGCTIEDLIEVTDDRTA